MTDIKEHINYKKLIFILKKLDLEFPVAEISRITGYSEPTISNYLNGKVKPSTKFLQSVVDTFNVELDNFGETKAFDLVMMNEPSEIYENTNGNKFVELKNGKFKIIVKKVPVNFQIIF